MSTLAACWLQTPSCAYTYLPTSPTLCYAHARSRGAKRICGRLPGCPRALLQIRVSAHCPDLVAHPTARRDPRRSPPDWCRPAERSCEAGSTGAAARPSPAPLPAAARSLPRAPSGRVGPRWGGGGGVWGRGGGARGSGCIANCENKQSVTISQCL